MLHKFIFRLLFSVFVVVTTSGASTQQDLVDLLKSGDANIILMRHALAPGTGDPDNFTLGQCDTQRNLNDVGRQQASATGKFLRQVNITFDSVFTSQWCRCVDTAELLDVGDGVVELPVINSFFQNMSEAPAQTQELRQWLTEQSFDAPVLLVTHQVNITAYTGVYPRSGELVVGNFDRAGMFTLLGTMGPL